MSKTDPAALARAAATIGVDADAGACARIASYLDAMLAENDRVNLTAIRDPEAALWLHAVDALGLALACPDGASSFFDLGTGNGFPGVAAAALWPEARTLLCDRTRKKADAVGRCVAHAGLHAEAAWLDADQVRSQHPELCSAFDVVTARAVADPVVVARSAHPLLAPGGRLVLWLTADDHPPVMLAGNLRKVSRQTYTLQVDPPRERAIAVWVKEG
ncbi:MAG: class I SAM-dependent methyltransferase [Planctomycetota bacterium]|nr:class I SAM-dependent methyltransferase [Planctomycetota bacterium]